MKYGSFVLLACFAMLSAGCGMEATNRNATGPGSRTVNKPVVEDHTRDAQPAGGDIKNPTSGTVIPDRVPTPDKPNAADPAAKKGRQTFRSPFSLDR